MTLSGTSNSRITLQITPEGTGYRVNVAVDDRAVATTIENSDYEAAVIGVRLAHRALGAFNYRREL